MEQHQRALALAALAASIERSLTHSLPTIVAHARTHDELTERLLHRNLLQLAQAASDLRQSAAQLIHAGSEPGDGSRAPLGNVDDQTTVAA